MKKNILLALIGLVCLQVGLVNAMAQQMGSKQEHLDTDLGKAAFAGNVSELKRLIKAGADINKRGLILTPLGWATTSARVDVVKALIEAGVDVNAKNTNSGLTALHIAAHRGEVEPIVALIEAGADIKIVDNKGRTPMELIVGNEARKAALSALITTVTPKEIQHIIPAIIALQQRKTLGKDAGKLIAAQLIPEIVREKLALAKKYLPEVPEDKLRQEIIQSINRVIRKSPRIQAAIQEAGAQYSIPILTIDELLGTYDREQAPE